MPKFSPRLAICLGLLAGAAQLAACRSGGPGPSPGASGSTAPVASAAPSASSAKPWTVTSSTFPVPRASVDLVLNPQGLPEYSGPTGSVEGTISVKGPAAPVEAIDVSKCPAALDTYGKLFREGAPATAGGSRPLGDAVVVAVGYTGFASPTRATPFTSPSGPNCAYPTRTLAITYGQRLDVSNKTRALFAPVIEDSTNVAVMVAPPREIGGAGEALPGEGGALPHQGPHGAVRVARISTSSATPSTQ